MVRNNKSVRTCLYTNKQFDRQELTRLVKINNKLVVDAKGNMLGRGYWLKVTESALADPKLLQILSKRTHCSLDEEFLKELKKYGKEN